MIRYLCLLAIYIVFYLVAMLLAPILPAFSSMRWCKKVGKKVLSFEAGWLLDVYLKDRLACHQSPLAPFQFQPQLKTAKV